MVYLLVVGWEELDSGLGTQAPHTTCYLPTIRVGMAALRDAPV